MGVGDVCVTKGLGYGDDLPLGAARLANMGTRVVRGCRVVEVRAMLCFMWRLPISLSRPRGRQQHPGAALDAHLLGPPTPVQAPRIPGGRGTT